MKKHAHSNVSFINYNAKDQNLDCHIQGFFHLKKQIRIDKYKLVDNNQLKKGKFGIKELLQIDKIHFDLVASDKDSILYCKKKHNKYSIHNHIIIKHENYLHLSKKEFSKNTITDSRKNHLAICRYSYDDLNDFLNMLGVTWNIVLRGHWLIMMKIQVYSIT
ncbi:18345_t:CDS:1 [Dentiscutata erythropus]|uniref:18345_t:CDS:1 n=1 Tax=Dentiscutata erythropus TaxID=1348616 RepID=A0A9N9ILK1_9GLOM|nr:18345_t:CDS:1 [Dentiscutata erythropus]